MKPRVWPALIVAVVAFSIAALDGSANAEIVGEARVIDGDTIEVQGQRIRLHGIDAPERRQTCQTRSDSLDVPCGDLATEYLRSLIDRAPRVRCVERGTGKYGRVIGVCSLAGGTTSGGLDLNDAMVRAGWALAYRRYSDDYADAEDDARRREVGIWALSFTPPWDWRAAQN